MENSPSQPPPSNQNRNRNRHKTLIYALIGIVVIAGVIAGLAYFVSIPPKEAKQNTNALFVGAYATYTGQTTVIGQTVTTTLRQEVVNLTSTQVEISNSLSIDSFVNLYKYQNTTWFSLGDPTFHVDNLTLINKSESNVTFPTVGTRECIIYNYNFTPNSNLEGTVTVYSDKNLGWAYKFDCNFTAEVIPINIELPLQDTNITGLK
jgi:hypothetical protein